MAMGWLPRACLACRSRFRSRGRSALGGALGAVNGALIVRSGLHSFIITLATMSVFFGVMVFISRAAGVSQSAPEISAFGKMRIEGYVSALLIVSVVVVWASSCSIA